MEGRKPIVDASCRRRTQVRGGRVRWPCFAGNRLTRPTTRSVERRAANFDEPPKWYGGQQGESDDMTPKEIRTKLEALSASWEKIAIIIEACQMPSLPIRTAQNDIVQLIREIDNTEGETNDNARN